MLDQNGMIELNFYPPKDENMTISTLGIEVNLSQTKSSIWHEPFGQMIYSYGDFLGSILRS